MARRSGNLPEFGTAFVSVHPGLEGVLAAELDELGVPTKPVDGGLTFPATLPHLATVHIGSRVAGRVLVRMGRVNADSLDQLATSARGLPWKRFVHPRQAIEVDVTSHESKLRRKDAVAKKLTLAIGDALRGPRLAGVRPPREPVRVMVRIDHNRAQLSIDASGDRLHLRGWRKATGGAPLRENLAAAVLRLAEWAPGTPLVDPMCGSGTFGIEAAQWAQGTHPGQGRDFAFHRWPAVDPKTLRGLGPDRQRAVPTAIRLSDRADGAIKATLSNAKRAGVARAIDVSHVGLEDLHPVGAPGLIVANPPWGQRLGDDDRIYGMYKHWGRHLRQHWAGWRLAVVVPQGRALDAWALGLGIKARIKSGGIPVVIGVGTI